LTRFGRITTKAARLSLLLLFALRAIAAPGLCAAQDAVAQSYQAAAGVAAHGPALTVTAADSTASEQKRAVSAGEPLEPGTEDYCDNPVVAGDSATALSKAGSSHYGDLMLGLQYGLCWPEPAMVSAVLQLSLSPPLVAWSTLDIAPRLRI